MRSASLSGTGYDFCFIVAIYIRGSNPDAAKESRMISVESRNKSSVCFKYFDMRSSAHSGTGNYFIYTIVIYITGRHINSSVKIREVCIKTCAGILRGVFWIKRTDMRSASLSCTRYKFYIAVRIKISCCNGSSKYKIVVR